MAALTSWYVKKPTELENAAVLPVLAGVLHYDISWFSNANRTASRGQGRAGTIRAAK
jgi:hypothetical protein